MENDSNILKDLYKTYKDAKKFLNYPNDAISAMHFIKGMSIAKNRNIMIKRILPFSILFNQDNG
ncbi:MAG: hypothetical protein M1331_01350 [Candidatus Marsarchaeota archaeon]|nr:hypothetical protein [Candidatus Marsarchaeota archaeon]